MYDIIESNTDNKLGKKGLIPVNSEMIDIKSQINKDYTIQFSIKSKEEKVPN